MNVAFSRASIKQRTGRLFVHFHINNSSLQTGRGADYRGKKAYRKSSNIRR